MREFTDYRLPDGRIVSVDASAANEAASIPFQLSNGTIVEASIVPLAYQERPRFIEGARAYFAGQRISDCPYPDSLWDEATQRYPRSDWFEGWSSARNGCLQQCDEPFDHFSRNLKGVS